MSGEYIPTTDVVKLAYTADRFGSINAAADAAFDRWLAAHDEEVANRATAVWKQETADWKSVAERGVANMRERAEAAEADRDRWRAKADKREREVLKLREAAEEAIDEVRHGRPNRAIEALTDALSTESGPFV